MAKGTELWDDSALINAFDAAMTSYKEMHSERMNKQTLDKEKVERNNTESDNVLAEESKSNRQIEFDADSKDTSGPSLNIGAATNVPFTQQNDGNASSFIPGCSPLISDHPSNGCSDHHYLNHDELLKQYYELEQSKEKIVQQLWQANYWNSQTPTNPQQQFSGSHVPELGSNSTCFWCTNKYLNAPLSSISGCTMAGTPSMRHDCCPQLILCCSGSQRAGTHCSTNGVKGSMVASFPMNHSVQGYDRAAEAVVMPVEMAWDSSQASLPSKVVFNEEKTKSKDNALGLDFASVNQKTELTTVLNAWYLAGYHTGRFILEQENRSKQQQTATKRKIAD